MSESSNLVPNLNEIIAEYAECEQEAVQTTQTEVERDEVRAEERAESEQPADETRKRKRRVEETSVEQTKEKASDWVSKQAYVAWRDKLQHGDFIGERCFNKLISPFHEVIESKGWHLFCEHKAL